MPHLWYQNIKYLGANLIRTVQNLYEENWKAFLHGSKVDFKKYKDLPHFGIPILMKVIYKFDTIKI